MSEVLTPQFAVFNGHINDADKRARALLKAISPNMLETIEDIEQRHKGIMGIFNEPATEVTAFYVALVTAYVNEKFRPVLSEHADLRELLAEKMREKGYGKS